MKKSDLKIIIAVIVMVYSFSIMVSAEPCNLQISMLNQDPYPAIPGEYVKVVFQINGIRNAECGTVTFGIKEDYPIYLDPNVKNPIIIDSGVYAKDYGSYYLAPYKLRLDVNALDGDNPIEIFYSTRTSFNIVKEFNINVKDIRADFEVHVKDYNYATKKLTLEILNTAKADVNALRIEIPKQESVEVKGSNRVNVGDLDSNEYTTADFEVILPEKESQISVILKYADSTSANTPRELQKVVDFDPSYFVNRNGDKKNFPWIGIVLVVLVIVLIVWRIIKKRRKEAERKRRRAAMK